jgi:hypothetical protein
VLGDSVGATISSLPETEGQATEGKEGSGCRMRLLPNERSGSELGIFNQYSLEPI